MELSPSQVQQYRTDGYLIIEDFFSHEECDALRERCRYIIEKADFSAHPKIVFNTKDSPQSTTDYFLTSGDKIRFFFEDGAIGKDGDLKVSKQLSLNKIGHALHELDPEFKKSTFSDKIKGVSQSLDLLHPAIVQSMYIFKQPQFGGSVSIHQDSTFLYTSPMTLVGFWIALEDANEENGCLWFIPKSHKNAVTKRMVLTRENGSLTTKFEGSDEPVSDSSFVAAPVKKGALVLIDGQIIHKSKENNSNRSRHVYTFHLYDAKRSVWSKENWLQPDEDAGFSHLY